MREKDRVFSVIYKQKEKYKKIADSHFILGVEIISNKVHGIDSSFSIDPIFNR